MRGTPGAAKVAETAVDWVLELREQRASDEELDRLRSTEHPTALMHKKHFDVFSNPNALALLEALAPERVVVYGVALDVCNRAAIEGMLDRGYSSITALTDATRPIRPDAAPELLASWAERGVELKTTAELLTEIS